MWHQPYISNHVLEKGAYDPIDYDGIPLGEPEMGLTQELLCLGHIA